MKKLILFAVFTVFLYNIVLAEAEEKRILAKSMLGIEALAPLPIITNNNQNNWGIDAFYRRNIDLFLKNNYLTANVGYIHYNKNQKIRDDYLFTFGLLTYNTYSFADYYTEIKIGVLNKNQKSYYDDYGHFFESSDSFKPLISCNIGASVPFPFLNTKFTRLHAAMKLRYDFDNKISSTINAGITQMFK